MLFLFFFYPHEKGGMNEKGKENYIFKRGSAFDYFCGNKKEKHFV
jgi:hypothetical protein